MNRAFYCFAVALWTSACALTTENIDVPYQPAGKAGPVDGASAATVSITGVDGRTAYRDRVSSKKNGYGMEMAAIVANNNIPQTVGNAIQQELSAQGFKIGPGHAEVSAEVVKFYNDFKIGFFSGDAYAEVALNVKVLTQGKTLVYAKYYEANGTEPNIQLATGDNARAALIVALRNAVHSVVSDPALQKALLSAQQPSTAGPDTSPSAASSAPAPPRDAEQVAGAAVADGAGGKSGAPARIAIIPRTGVLAEDLKGHWILYSDDLFSGAVNTERQQALLMRCEKSYATFTMQSASLVVDSYRQAVVLSSRYNIAAQQSNSLLVTSESGQRMMDVSLREETRFAPLGLAPDILVLTNRTSGRGYALPRTYVRCPTVL
jgi:uncharacterized lipoprotein